MHHHLHDALHIRSRPTRFPLVLPMCKCKDLIALLCQESPSIDFSSNIQGTTPRRYTLVEEDIHVWKSTCSFSLHSFKESFQYTTTPNQNMRNIQESLILAFSKDS